MYNSGDQVKYDGEWVRVIEILANNSYYIDYTDSYGNHTIVHESELST